MTAEAIDSFIDEAQGLGFTEREARIAAAVALDVALRTILSGRPLDHDRALDVARARLKRWGQP